MFGPDLERGLGIDLSLDMLLLARARIERAGLRHCSVRQGDIYDLAVPAGSLRRRHHPSGAALPRRRRARDPRGGARAGARRPAAGGRLRAARSGIPARGARASPPRIFRRGRDAMDDAPRASTSPCIEPFAGARLRRQDRGVALARARSARARSPTTRARWRDGAADPRLVRVLPAEDRGDGEKSLGGDRRGLRRSRRISSR